MQGKFKPLTIIGVRESRIIKCPQLPEKYAASRQTRDTEYMRPDSTTTNMTGLSALAVWRNFPAARSTDHIRYTMRTAWKGN